MKASRFKARFDVPRYSRVLLETISTPVVVYLFLIGNFVLAGASLGFYAVEVGVNPNVNSIFDAFWWGIATVTTVGFGDIVPVTQGGRAIGFALIATGVLFFVGSSAFLSSTFFARTRADIVGLEAENQEEFNQVIDAVTDLRREIIALRREVRDGRFEGLHVRLPPS